MDPAREPAPVEEQQAPVPAHAVAPPPGAAGRVLDLQGSIGNRGVLQLLRETDPALTWTQKAIGEGKGLDAQKLPWKVAGDQKAGWDALEILSKLTQVDESAKTFTDAVRCGANSVLAVAITRGPFDTEVFARGVMLKALAGSTDKSLTTDRQKEMGDAYNDIWPAIRDLGRGTATYGDLSSIAHYAKVAMSKSPTGATTGHEVTAMANLLGGLQSSGAPVEDAEHLKSFAKDLKPGQSYILLVDTDILLHETKTRNLQQANHYIVLGKDPNGRNFLYDPYPREGAQLLRSSDPGFSAYFTNAEGDWKSTYVFIRPKLG